MSLKINSKAYSVANRALVSFRSAFFSEKTLQRKTINEVCEWAVGWWKKSGFYACLGDCADSIIRGVVASYVDKRFYEDLLVLYLAKSCAVVDIVEVL